MAEKVFPGRDYGVEIAAGNVVGKHVIQRTGYNPAVGSSPETVWDHDGLYPYLTEAAAMKLSSSSAEDDAGGTGALTVLVDGMDADYNLQTEIVTLDGQTGVDTANEYLRIFALTVLTAGSTGANVGDVYIGTGTITDGVPANVYGRIRPTKNNTAMALYTIPAGHTGYVERGYIGSGKAQDAVGEFYVRPYGLVFARRQVQQVYQNFLNYEPSFPYAIPEKSDIELRATSETTVAIAGGFDLLIVDNT